MPSRETSSAAIRDDVHQVQPHAISITQASEYGCCYSPGELAAIDALAGPRGLKLHMDGARFANAVAFLNRPPAEVAGPVDALSFGFVKNGAMNAEAIVFFDAARGWANDDSRLRGAADTETLYDVGAGILLGDVGIYTAVPLTGEDRSLRFFVRLGPRF